MKKSIIVLFLSAIVAVTVMGCKKDILKIEDVTTAEENTSEVSIGTIRGMVEDGMYVNKRFGISFKVDEDCTIFSDEMILTVLGIASDMLNEGEEFSSEDIEGLLDGMVPDYMHLYGDNKSSLNIIFVKLSEAECPNLSIDEYVEISCQQIEQSGMADYTIAPIEKRVYGGKEYVCIDAVTDIGMEQHALICIQDGYAITITMSDFSGGKYYEQFINSFIEVE
ncbi:MAG: hypothetical protein ACI4D8_02410 [Wujia sp.]